MSDRSEPASQVDTAVHERARHILVEKWDTVFHIGGRDDTLLGLPRLLAAGHRRIHAYDYGDRTVKTFDSAGNLIWVAGRSGDGPGEFRNPFAIDVGVDRRIWVTDTGAGRLSALDADGGFEGIVRHPGQMVTAGVPYQDGVIALSAFLDPFWAWIDRDGNVRAQGEFPVGESDGTHPFAIRPLASGTGGSVWAVAYPRGNRFHVYRDTALHCEGRLIEGGPFPTDIGADPPVWVVDIEVSDTEVLLLARGLTDDRLRLVDKYSTEDCAYVGSYLLPRRMSAMATSDGVLYFHYEDPHPVIMGIRPSSSQE